MGFVLGFLPWVVYWALVGNAPFRLAVGVALVVALAAQLLSWSRGVRMRTLEVGNLAVFVALLVAAFVLPDAVLGRWLQPLGNAGVLLIALVGVLVGRPFVSEYAASSVDARTASTDGFRAITTAMTWLWVVIFAGMTVSALVPPLLDGAATLTDEGDALSVVCYWVVPFALTGLGGVLCGMFPSWFETRTALVDRRAARPTDAARLPSSARRPLTSSPTGSTFRYRHAAATTSRSRWS